MLFKKPPFSRALANDIFFYCIIKNDANSFWKIHQLKGARVENLTSECKDLLFQLLSFNPDSRPSIDDILNSSWLK